MQPPGTYEVLRSFVVVFLPTGFYLFQVSVLLFHTFLKIKVVSHYVLLTGLELTV